MKAVKPVKDAKLPKEPKGPKASKDNGMDDDDDVQIVHDDDVKLVKVKPFDKKAKKREREGRVEQRFPTVLPRLEQPEPSVPSVVKGDRRTMPATQAACAKDMTADIYANFVARMSGTRAEPGGRTGALASVACFAAHGRDVPLPLELQKFSST